MGGNRSQRALSAASGQCNPLPDQLHSQLYIRRETEKVPNSEHHPAHSLLIQLEYANRG